MTEELLSGLTEDLKQYPIVTKGELLLRGIKRLLFARLVPIDRFSWPQGMMTLALEQVYSHALPEQEAEIRPAVLGALTSYFDYYAGKGLKLYHLDDTMNGYALLFLYGLEKKPVYKRMADELALYLKGHLRAGDGSLPYRQRQEEDIYIDAIGMITPFLIRYGLLFGDEESIKMAVRQIENFLSSGMDEATGLPFQAYRTESKEKLGIIGWGRSVGWMLLGMTETLVCLKQYGNESIADDILRAMTELLAAVSQYQLQDGSYRWQITAAEGHKDTSAAAMITYALLRGMEHELLSFSYWGMAEKGIQSLMRSQRNGKIYDCSGECGGFGIYSQNYGAYPWSSAPAAAAYSVYESLLRVKELD